MLWKSFIIRRYYILNNLGYSIMYPNNNGISLAVNAKFYTTLKEN